MTILELTGSPQFPQIEGAIPPTSHADIDAALEVLNTNKDAWVRTGIPERIAILTQILHDTEAIAEEWVAANLQDKGLRAGTTPAGDEWAPVAVTLRVVRLLRQSLQDIEKDGCPRIPGKVYTRPDGRVVANVFPQTLYDKILFNGIRGEVWMTPDVTEATLPQTMASMYRDKNHPGKIALVLAAGNASCLGPTGFLTKLFVEDQVVIVKTNPVNAYNGPLWERGFRALVERGVLRVTHGGVDEANYIIQHALVDEIQLTGSDKTHDAIVFGPSEEGHRRKAERQPIMTKPITAELGNVSPVIIVPGPWSEGDVAYHAGYIASQLVNNAGFYCLTTRVVIQHEGWNQRQHMLDAVRYVLSQLETRKAYYPGAFDRHQQFTTAHPQAETYGEASPDELPWTFIPDVDPTTDDITFHTEAFCGLFAETALPGASVAEYIDNAVAFANEKLWGTLTATLIVHPKSLKDPVIAAAVDRAVGALRYGNIGVNLWGAMSYFIGLTPWGGHAGQDIFDIQSGIGHINNTLMFEKVQKTVVRGPFKIRPNPLAVTHARYHEFCRHYAYYEVEPGVRKVLPMLWAALRG